MLDTKVTTLPLEAQPDERKRKRRILSCLDDAGVDELHDVLTHRRVLHVVLQRGGIRLRLLEDRLHDRVAHDFLCESSVYLHFTSILEITYSNLGIPHGPLECLLLCLTLSLTP